jgi:integrase
MARKATGTVVYEPADPAKGIEGHYRARITLADGSRPWIDLDPGPKSPKAEESARGKAAHWTERARAEGRTRADFAMRSGAEPTSPAPGETWNDWHVRYLEAHEALGKQTREMKGAGRKWLSDRIGMKPMTSIRREDVVAIRDGLTRAVLASEITAKRAMNIWSDLVSAPFSRAFTDDDPRYSAVRMGPASANPATGIKPPVTKAQLDEDARARQPMYPHEFAQLMACAAVPPAAKRIYALAVFLYARPQEFYALRWTDVDWTAREIRVRRKLDVRTGEERPGTKSDAGIREIPIHPNLMPLLVAMHEERESDGARILPLVGSARFFERFADQTRRHVKAAGIDRRELVVGTEDLMPFDFRSWRTTGCTWLAMLGTDSYVIAQQAGHKSPDTTWGSYIKRGPDLRQRHGEPFPPLPAELLSRVESSGESSGALGKSVSRGNVGGEGGIRTRGPLLTDARLASGYLRPLGHLS